VPQAKQLDDLEATRRYYDEFAQRYDDKRGGRVAGGYHDLLDELEMGFLERFATGKEVLEVGCGTGLLLEQMKRFVKSAEGVDLSPGMLERARERGLTVRHGSVTALPFEDRSYDVVCSFKVLAHVREIHQGMSEMLRVLRPGGVLVAEFYNRRSLRALLKRLGPAQAISDKTDESAILTRFDTPSEVASMLPAGYFIEAARGVRIVTPVAGALSLPVIGGVLGELERRLCDGPLSSFGGFWIAAIRKP
jgi:ubiquinone/menaquinone biosynthesis C-methylase UbiE